MVATLNDLDEAISLALEEADQKLASGQPFQTIAAAFTSVVDRFIKALDGDWRALELQRRVAEGILRAARARGLPTSECEVLLGRIIDLGFSDLYTRSLIIFGFSGYCDQHGDGPRALRYLRPLISEVEEELARSGQAKWSNCLSDCRELLARIEQRDDDRRRDQG